jgi:septum formation protein
MTAPALLLASTSIHRRALLSRLQLPFTSVAPDVDEQQAQGELPWNRAMRLAQAKARWLAALRPDAIVIGSDQVASIATGDLHVILRKPGDRDTCREQLLAMSGRVARFDTAVAVAHRGQLRTHADLTHVRMRELDGAQIDSYMDREPAFDCAGGFKCEGLGVTLFESIESADPTALVGLPLIWLCAALRQLDVPV